jgi:hypothetical protein
VKGSSGLSAGFLLVLIDVLCLGGGYLLARSSSSVSLVGGLIGGAIVGFPLSFYVVWATYVRPLKEQSLLKDYSHLPTYTDDDDD